MSLVVQVGQCGNQLGGALLSRLWPLDQDAGEFFTDGVANTLLVDTERKVVSASLLSDQPWRIHKSASCTARAGAANNWARGYFDHGAALRDQVEDALMSASERQPVLSSLLLIHSLAGGTGSGLGSLLAELSRDLLGHKTAIISQVVAPYVTGEVATQSYNSTLALSHELTHSDMVLFADNATAEARTRVAAGRPSTGSDNTVTMSAINKHLATQLATFLSPPVKLWELAAVLSHPAWKFTRLSAAPDVPSSAAFDTYTWPALTRALQTVAGGKRECSRGVLVVRGPESADADVSAFAPMQVTRSPHGYGEHCRHIAVASHAPETITNLLTPIVEHAWKMFSAGAYLHHYAPLEEEHFTRAFATLEQTLADYSSTLL